MLARHEISDTSPGVRPASVRATAESDLTRKIRSIHAASRKTCGAARIITKGIVEKFPHGSLSMMSIARRVKRAWEGLLIGALARGRKAQNREAAAKAKLKVDRGSFKMGHSLLREGRT